jgi:YafQ family addiction module toxin component
MDYALEIMPSCREAIEKAGRKNPVLKKAVTNKIDEILKNPEHYKPLRGVLAGERRVHILKSFVLIYEIVPSRKAVCFTRFSHHDKAY